MCAGFAPSKNVCRCYKRPAEGHLGSPCSSQEAVKEASRAGGARSCPTEKAGMPPQPQVTESTEAESSETQEVQCSRDGPVRVQPLTQDWCPHKGRHKSICIFSVPCEDTRERHLQVARKRALAINQICQHLDLKLPASRAMDNKCWQSCRSGAFLLQQYRATSSGYGQWCHSSVQWC